MKKWEWFLATLCAAVCLLLGSAVVPARAAAANAQVSVGVNIGPAPDCPYGYYDSSPYDCAPYGYYGPEWFTNGVFIGAGPWFHGHDDFRGHVDNRFDVHHGYHGELPHRGDKRDASRRLDHNDKFRGNEMRDGRGHVLENREGRH